MGVSCLVVSTVAILLGQSQAPARPKPGGLLGLGPPGGLMKQVDPKVRRFEAELLSVLNEVRRKQGLPPVSMDDRLRSFARREAELAATGSQETRTVQDRIKRLRLAPFGHRIQYSYGKKALGVLRELQKDAQVREALVADFSRAGVGAFWVPEKVPYFQVALLLVRDPDPRAAKPGLSREQTDSITSAATPRFLRCYDKALKKDPNLAGNLLIRMIIGSTGAVQEAKLIRGLGELTFDGCALEIAWSLVFPKPYKGKPVTLHHPMRFSPPQGNRRIGKLTDTQVAGAFRIASSDFRACYDRRSKDKPGLEGDITVAGIVAPDGSFGSVEIILDEPGDKQLAACVLKRAKQLRFPRPKFDGEVDVSFPVHFSPSTYNQGGR